MHETELCFVNKWLVWKLLLAVYNFILFVGITVNGFLSVDAHVKYNILWIFYKLLITVKCSVIKVCVKSLSLAHLRNPQIHKK